MGVGGVNVTIAAFTLGAVLGLPPGYFLGWLVDLLTLAHKVATVFIEFHAVDAIMLSIASHFKDENE